MERRLLTAAGVARKLGRSLSWFQRQREALERDKGFPLPVDGCGHRWDPVAIDAWLDRQRGPASSPSIDGELLRRAQAAIGEVQRAALVAPAPAPWVGASWPR
jgi:hypothetical protein